MYIILLTITFVKQCNTLFLYSNSINILGTWSPGPVITKLFQSKDQDQTQVKHSYIMAFFKTYCHCLTIDLWCLVKFVLQSRLLRILSFFYQRKGYVYSCDRYENLSPLNNRINFIIVNCLQHVLSSYIFSV